MHSGDNYVGKRREKEAQAPSIARLVHCLCVEQPEREKNGREIALPHLDVNQNAEHESLAQCRVSAVGWRRWADKRRCPSSFRCPVRQLHCEPHHRCCAPSENPEFIGINQFLLTLLGWQAEKARPLFSLFSNHPSSRTRSPPTVHDQPIASNWLRDNISEHDHRSVV